MCYHFSHILTNKLTGKPHPVWFLPDTFACPVEWGLESNYFPNHLSSCSMACCLCSSLMWIATAASAIANTPKSSE